MTTIKYYICDWIYENSSKLHIVSYEIIDFKIIKHYNQPRIMNTQMKLKQKVDHLTEFKNFLSTSCCSQKFPPNKKEIFDWLDMQGSIKGCLHWMGGGGWTGRKRL